MMPKGLKMATCVTIGRRFAPGNAWLPHPFRHIFTNAMA